jgi:DNA adenine methylase
MPQQLRAAWPWPGGKGLVISDIWARLGDPPNFDDPFCGTAISILARPPARTGARRVETINDIDGFVTNALRSIAFDPEQTAYWCDSPINEINLTAAQLWLKAQREALTLRLFADPDHYNPKIAGRWLWGIASWIGDGWCVADGPWLNIGGRLVDRRTLPEGSQFKGVRKKMPKVLGDEHESDMGIQTRRKDMSRKTLNISANSVGIDTGETALGVRKKMPAIGGRGEENSTSPIQRGILAENLTVPGALLDYFHAFSDRMRLVRMLCGDWRRCLKDSVTTQHGLTGILLDPPYDSADHEIQYHKGDRAAGAPDLWHQVAHWAIENGGNELLRIAVCGYWSEESDALFPASWERLRWQANGGYANQSNKRGRENAKRECVWFSPHCLNPAEEAIKRFGQAIPAAHNDWAGTMFQLPDGNERAG